MAHVRIVHQFEGQGGERFVIGGAALFDLARLVHPAHRQDVQRAGQVVDHGVEQRLHAFVAEGAAQQNGDAAQRVGRSAHSGLDHRRGQFLFRQIGIHNLVVRFSQGLDQLFTGLSRLFFIIRWNLFRPVSSPRRLFIVDQGFFFDKVDDPFQLTFEPQGDLKQNRFGLSR